MANRCCSHTSYADAPSYTPVGAPGEGIVCVDDVARAAVVYLDEHARTGDAHALDQARGALNFTLRMQQPDGRFTNFVTDEQGTINRTGATSKPALGWWAFRGMWALARGYREFVGIDAVYGAQLLSAYQRSEHALVEQLGDDASIRWRGRTVPAWLDRVPADQASVAALALAEMQQARPNAVTGTVLTKVADGISSLQQHAGRDGALGYSGHTTWYPDEWHAWGAHEAEALARAGEVLHRTDFVNAAQTAIEGVLSWQLAAGRVQQLTPLPDRSGQQAYGVAAATRASMAVYRATGDVRYARMAGLHASWLLGNNMANSPMYDPATGRGYDGIDEVPRGVNHSSGAESTIESLMTLQAIAGSPVAERFATMRPLLMRPEAEVTDTSTSPHSWVAAPASSLRDVATNASVSLTSVGAGAAADAPVLQVAQLRGGSNSHVTIDVPVAGNYVVLAAHVRGGAQLSFRIDGRLAGSMRGGDAHEPLADGQHPALDQAVGRALHLAAGAHEVVVAAGGNSAAPPALLQGLVLHPTRAATTFSDAAGARVTASFDLAAGRLHIDEQSRPSAQ